MFIIWKLIPQDQKDRAAASRNLKVVDKVYKKFESTMWSGKSCYRDGSKMFVSTGPWHDMFGDHRATTNMVLVCPTCGWRWEFQSDPKTPVTGESPAAAAVAGTEMTHK
jgi:hypothetical protein